MQELVYPRERSLGAITLALGLIAWFLLIVGSVGIALFLLLFSFLSYLFAQSALIAHLKGNGIRLSESQLPELYSHFVACCDRLQMTTRPEAYVLNGGGMLNAFATRFLGTQYVILHSDVIDAMRAHPNGVRFYIGHEIGHLRMKHLTGQLWRWPVLWLPLLGAAYSRARESTCDRHGRACCDNAEEAARALLALSAGAKLWKQVDIASIGQQTQMTRGFWMSFHELIGAYPWISKRVQRVIAPDEQLPKRNFFAYPFALFVPFAGRLGGLFGFLIMVYVITGLSVVGVVLYTDYRAKAQLASAYQSSQQVLTSLADFYEKNEEIPDSLEAVGINSELSDGSELSLDTSTMKLTVTTGNGDLEFTPELDDEGKVVWTCTTSGVSKGRVPAGCELGGLEALLNTGR